MTFETVTTLSGERVVLDLIVGNFIHVLQVAHGMDAFVLDLLVTAARRTSQEPSIIAQGVVSYLTTSKDPIDAAKLLEALVITLREASYDSAL